ncbi:ATP-binding protein [Pseudoalteromonas sp. DY56-GL22]|uniref:sensor histidine kinase n=1 Tax=Pseudoalteromonas sp. DY56-GL22 TaxID=2967126 RepID=UPI00352ADDEA
MSSLSKKFIAAGVLLIMLLILVFYLGRSHDYEQAQHQSQTQATQLSHYIASELARFKTIPSLVSANDLVKSFIVEKGAGGDAVNDYLEDIQRASGASDVYVMDLSGTVLASSNWQVDYTFLGSNFAFRPYFYLAKQGEKVAYFALGMRSSERGFYFSEPLFYQGEVVAVVALKVNAKKFEQDRQLLNASDTSHFYIALEDNVIVMSDVADWRLKSLKPLDNEQMAALVKSRRYLSHKPTLLPYTHKPLNEQTILQKVLLNGKQSRFISAVESIEIINAKASVLVDVTNVELAQIPRLLWFSVFYAIAVGLIHTAMVRFAGYKKLLFSRHSLEQEVIERTQALEKAQKALIQTAKLATIGQLSAGINHEINQPLSAMNTYLVSAKRLLIKGNIEQASENLVLVQSLIERVHKIVAQLKHFSKPAQTQLRQQSLASMLKNALMIASAQLKQDDIEVKAADIDANITVWVDSVKFEQVLVNVITNASQAMSESDKRELSFELELFDDRVKLSILDTGPGIDQHALGNIFEPFYSTKTSNGLGLGLSISRQIIDSFNGRLTAHNRPKGGAQFIITLQTNKETS